MTNTIHSPHSQPGTRSERPIPGGSNMNISPPSPAQAVSSISAYQSRVAQFVPPPSHPVFPTPGNSRSQSIQRLGASNRNHRGRRNQYPQGPTLSRSGIAPPPPGLTVTVVIVPFKVEHFRIKPLNHNILTGLYNFQASCIQRYLHDQRSVYSTRNTNPAI